jgi:RNA recognition motif-containing protein
MSNQHSGDAGTSSPTDSAVRKSETEREPAPPNCNLYVGNLAPTVADADILQHFGPFGPIVSAKVMLNIHTGISRGIAFVQFEVEEHATRALTELSGSDLHGSSIVVKYADQKAAYNPGPPTNRIFVRNLPAGLSQENIAAFFGQWGKVIECVFHPDRANQRKKAVAETQNAYVTFADVEMAKVAAEKVHGAKPFQESVVPLLAKVAETEERRELRLQRMRERSKKAQQAQMLNSPSSQGQHANPSGETSFTISTDSNADSFRRSEDDAEMSGVLSHPAPVLGLSGVVRSAPTLSKMRSPPDSARGKNSAFPRSSSGNLPGRARGQNPHHSRGRGGAEFVGAAPSIRIGPSAAGTNFAPGGPSTTMQNLSAVGDQLISPILPPEQTHSNYGSGTFLPAGLQPLALPPPAVAISQHPQVKAGFGQPTMTLQMQPAPQQSNAAGQYGYSQSGYQHQQAQHQHNTRYQGGPGATVFSAPQPPQQQQQTVLLSYAAVPSDANLQSSGSGFIVRNPSGPSEAPRSPTIGPSSLSNSGSTGSVIILVPASTQPTQGHHQVSNQPQGAVLLTSPPNQPFPTTYTYGPMASVQNIPNHGAPSVYHQYPMGGQQGAVGYYASATPPPPQQQQQQHPAHAAPPQYQQVYYQSPNWN